MRLLLERHRGHAHPSAALPPSNSGLNKIQVQPSQFVTPGNVWAFQSSVPFPIPPLPPPVIPRTAVVQCGPRGLPAQHLVRGQPLCTATPTTTSSGWLPPSPHTSLHPPPPIAGVALIPSRRLCCYKTPPRLSGLDPPTPWHLLTTTVGFTWMGTLVGQVDVAAPDAAERWAGLPAASGVEWCLRPR